MAPTSTKSKSALDLPWAERHRPRHLGQVVGNTDQVRKLAEWLRDWDDVVLKGKKKEPPAQTESWRTWKPVVENINARACLISGPPGIGKTTTCCLVARCNHKYKLMEYNASDARGKTIIDSMSNSIAGNHTLNLSGKGGAIERAVIIMDECDGMAGGGDKGGMQALINMIKATKNPIICICNDRGDQQVRNLAPHCFDIKFRKPDNLLVAKRIKSILEGEGKRVDPMAIEATVEACGHDIRQVLNHVQFFGGGRGTNQKDTQVALSPFEAVTQLLSPPEGGKTILPMEKRLDMFYIDADLMPLMIQENYLKTFEKRGGSIEEEELARCAQAAELIAMGDSMSGSWEVMGSAAVVGSLYPAWLATVKEPLTRPAFPSWLQKRSGMTKAKAMAQDMHSHVKVATTTSIRGLVTTSYHDLLHLRMLRPLQIGSPKDCAAGLAVYGLTREFFTDQAPALRKPLQLDDNYWKVDGKLKHALLQELQAMSQQNMVTKRKREAGEDGGSRRRGGRAGGGEDTGAAGDEAGDVGDTGDAEGEEGGLFKGKKVAKKADKVKTTKGKSGGVDNSKCSLSGWKSQTNDAKGTDADGRSREKKPMLIFKYLDGHTNAVRRKVHLEDILGPWILF